ncbi:DoxX family protein [Falsibacillus albus]|uniref:DoxX family protein n=1 Tax=Falsibacillus albus TaxID=2478915 RepID=A0A3L7K312_9BACI|nr:DoxX family protein [Falsibacillus albus]RLQ97497.1 DoxX family protein [Falsibacillus albus]
MIIKYIREGMVPSFILAIIRLYLGYTWLTAGLEKILGGEFDASGFLQQALSKTSGSHPAVQPWWGFFLEHLILPNADVFTILVMWGELLVGIGLLMGCFTKTSAFFALLMNISYLFSGSTSTNPQLVLLTFFIIISGMNAGKWGLDGILSKNMNRNASQESSEIALQKSL